MDLELVKSNCFFYKSGSCELFKQPMCEKKKKKCSFFKTETEYLENWDRAVLINRERGRCQDCKYMGGMECQLSTESKKTKKNKSFWL